MADRLVRAAFFGAGHHATHNLYPALQKVGFELVCVCDLDLERAKAVAQRFGAPNAMSDWKEVLGAHEFDAALVCGPPEMHHEIALGLLRAGIPTFVEKPTAPTAAKAWELAEAGTWGMTGFMKRFASRYADARALFGKPGFGELTHAVVRYSHGYRTDKLALLSLMAIHPIDLMLAFGGRLSEVSWQFSTLPETACLSARFRFESGAIGTLVSDNTIPGVLERVELAGTEGFISIDDVVHWRHYLPNDDPWGAPEARLLTPNFALQIDATNSAILQGYVPMLAEFASAVREGRAVPEGTLHDGALALELCEAIAAADSGKWSPNR